VREKQGLAYSVYSSLNTNDDSANITIYAGTDSKNVKKVIGIIAYELQKIKKSGFKKSDLDLFKTQVRAQLLMGSDDIENRMASLGVNEMVFKNYRSVEKVIEEIEAVSEKSMRLYLKKYFDLKKVAIVLMGPNLKADKDWLTNFDFTK
jgi:predicted Zn-dependent peptidase